MPDTELTPWQRLVLAFWAFFAILFRLDVARGVERVRLDHRLASARALGSGGAPAETSGGNGGSSVAARPPPRDPRAGERNGGAAHARGAQPEIAIAPPPKAAPAPAPVPAPASVPAAAPAKAEPDHRAALQVLAVLQREGRLVDFLEEDLAGFPDASIGAAARTVHAGCKKALEELFRLEPVYREREGERVTVKPGFDPAAVRLTGNVVGQPPFQGALRHHGWRVREVKLPPVDGKDATILAPAEVEL